MSGEAAYEVIVDNNTSKENVEQDGEFTLSLSK